MKHLVFILIFGCYISTNAFSQKVYLVPKMGLTRSNVFYNTSLHKMIGRYNAKLHFGGALVFEPRNGIRFCLGLERWERGYIVNYPNQNSGSNTPSFYYKLHLFYEESPIYSEIYFGKQAKVLIQAGLAINHLIEQKIEFPKDLFLIDFYGEPVYRKFEQSILLGFGIEIPFDKRISLKVNSTSRIGVSGLRPNQKLYSKKQTHNISYGVELGLGICIFQ